MRSVTDTLHNSGGSVEYTCKDGKLVKIKFMDLKAMSQYEQKLQSKAIKVLADMKELLPADTWNQMFSELMDKISAGHYAFGSEITSKSLNTVNGVGDLIAILCDITAEEAIGIVLKEGETFRKVFDHVIRSSVSSPDDEESEQKKS